MDDRQAYCDHLEKQLQVLEGQIQGVNEKLAQATPDGKAAMLQLVERWNTAALLARRRLAELRQDGDQWEERKADTDQMWNELQLLVDSAKAAF